MAGGSAGPAACPLACPSHAAASVAPLWPSRAYVVARVPSLRARRPCARAARYAEARSGIPPGLRATFPGHAKRPPSPEDDGIIALALCAELGRQALEPPTRWPRSWPGSPPRPAPAYSGLGF